MVGLSLHLGNEIAARDYGKRALAAIERGALEYSLTMYGAVHDAAVVIGKAMEKLLMSAEGRKMIHSYGINGSCPLQSMDNEDKGLGQRILNELKKVSFKGLTGDVQFDGESGERKVQDGMDILNVLPQQVGSWKPEAGDNGAHVLQKKSEEPKWIGNFYETVKCHNPGSNSSRPEMRLPKLTITTVLELHHYKYLQGKSIEMSCDGHLNWDECPIGCNCMGSHQFVERVNKSAKLEDIAGKITGDNVLQGFLIDVIKEVSKEAKFEYEIYLRGDSKYSDVIEELIDQKAGEPPINNFAFLQPFTGGVWLSTIGVVLFITAMMCVMDYLSPFGYRARARESDDEPGDEFNMLNSLWFATASVLQQGPDNTPLAPSGRLLASTFWFFILILISTYTANLAAFFTIKRTADTINSLEALANQDKIKYGVFKGGSVRTFFENSEDSLYRKMYSHMREYQTFVEGTAAGVERARTEQYAYITEYPYLDYYNQQKPCNTRLLKNLIQTKSYGIGLQRNSPYTNKITVAILKLREKNFIEKTRRRWWDDRSQCPKPSQSKTGNTQSLDVNNLAGVFIILLGGIVVSLVLVVIEIRCRKLVVFLTNSQRALKRRLSTRETREQPRDSNNTRMRMGVVLSQGDRVLKPVRQHEPETSGWRKWFGMD
ncbi:hypothetical protein OS493_000889 [Desmophyllum pertusum]|uniref:Ionotropic glutamate receptor C-terminal domain-containing protein n=1 Tax=Desmophyllum pertusum TaxID=174260 RepID=A0A9W9ZTB7_9CNID|nr:hypothetical protein OS493_000889 [Desmophyllum pertusum]